MDIPVFEIAPEAQTLEDFYLALMRRPGEGGATEGGQRRSD
jgi:hypothetical protein